MVRTAANTLMHYFIFLCKTITSLATIDNKFKLRGVEWTKNSHFAPTDW